MIVRFAGKRVRVGVSRYGNRRMALILQEAAEDDRPLAATTNFPGAEDLLGPGELLVLNDGKEAGALDALQENDIVRTTGKTIATPAGRTAHVCVAGAKLELPDEF